MSVSLIRSSPMKRLIPCPPALRYNAFAVATSIRTLRSHAFPPPSWSIRSSSTFTGAHKERYAAAIRRLEGLRSNRAVVSTISQSRSGDGTLPPRDANLDAIPEMLEWTRRAGYRPSDLADSGLRCVHVAGTKGKGSVCVMVESILLAYRGAGLANGGEGPVLGRIGLYTSPHLITVRERIRIDGKPISEELFGKYFFQLWERIEKAAQVGDRDMLLEEQMPSYFRYLTILALHIFMEEGVQTAIIECGIGGEYDSTNILPPAAVTTSAITRLGIDHQGMLGDTIEQISWHKAGIMKEGVPVFTAEQVSGAMAVLEERAEAKGVKLSLVARNPELDQRHIKLGLEGEFQKDNASLAIAVAASHLRTMSITEGNTTSCSDSQPKISPQIARALESVKWQGRCEVIKENNIEWLIDGAHTIDSIEATAMWFCKKLFEAAEGPNPPTATMLIFNQQDRDAKALLTKLLAVIAKHTSTDRSFTYAAFCTNTVLAANRDTDLHAQRRLEEQYVWAARTSASAVYGSIEEAVGLARRVAQGEGEKVLVLVTGSLYLVGGLLQVLGK